MRPLSWIPSFVLIASLLGLSALSACAQEPRPLPDCEWCGAAEAPDDVSWTTTIAGADEPGEPMVITGTVYRPDGETPAPGILLYVYHTNAEGIYPTRGDEQGNARRHGYLRGWMRTDAAGRYRFTTIRPGTYPSRNEPAHVHMTIKEPDRAEHWVDSIVFADDPLVDADYRAEQDERGGSGIVALTRDEDGVWRGQRDVVLKE
jgi:protocatechuate 3,4-dioxygenase beta subunit